MNPKCGIMYRHLIRSADGDTPEDPCGLFCWEGNYASWNDGARDLGGRVKRAYRVLQNLSPQRAEVLGPNLEAWLERIDDLPGRFEALLTGGSPSSIEKRINVTIDLMDEGVCIFERIQDDLDTDGHDRIPVAEAPESPDAEGGWGIGTWIVAGVVTAGLAGAAWYGLTHLGVKKEIEA